MAERPFILYNSSSSENNAAVHGNNSLDKDTKLHRNAQC